MPKDMFRCGWERPRNWSPVRDVSGELVNWPVSCNVASGSPEHVGARSVILAVLRVFAR